MEPKLRLVSSNNQPSSGAKREARKICDERPNKSVPKGSIEVEDSLSLRPTGYVGIADLARFYGVSKSSIYDLIKSEPSFPYKNVGRKKKYVVSVDEYEQWLANRTTQEKSATFNIPTGADLLERFKK